MTREEKERLLAEIEKQYKWLMTKSPTIYMMDIAFDAIRKAVRDEAEQEPKISLDTYKQVTKERDIAIEQLHELGYEFGEKIEPTINNDLGVDCISKQAVIDIVMDMYGLGRADVLADTLTKIDNLPSVTPQEPKKGHWINYDYDEDKYDKIKCSECGHIFIVDSYHWCDIGFTKDDLNYCPNCGARMDKENKE